MGRNRRHGSSRFVLFLRLFAEKYERVIKLNGIFILLCLPIVTIPAGVAGMSRVSYFLIENEYCKPLPECRRVLKDAFVRCLVTGLFYLAVLSVSSLTAWFYFRAAMERWLMFIPGLLAVMVSAMGVMMSFFSFPMLGMSDLPVKAVISNSLRMVFLCPKESVTALALTAALAGITWCFLPFTLLLAVVLFAFSNLLAGYYVHDGLREYVFPDQELHTVR